MITDNIFFCTKNNRNSLVNTFFINKKTECAINAAGALRDTAFKLFRGTIDFIKGSAGSVGNEKEEVLLIDEKCVNQTIPIILVPVFLLIQDRIKAPHQAFL